MGTLQWRLREGKSRGKGEGERGGERGGEQKEKK